MRISFDKYIYHDQKKFEHKNIRKTDKFSRRALKPHTLEVNLNSTS